MLCVCTLINRLGTMALPFLVLYLTRHLGFTPQQAASVLVAYGCAAFLAAPLGGWLADRFGAVRLMTASLLATSAAMLLFTRAHDYPTVVAAAVAWALVSEIFRPASMSEVGALAGERLRKPGFALNRLAANVGMSLGPAAGGWLAQWSFPSLFYANAATSFAAACWLASQFPMRGGGPDQRLEHRGSMLRSVAEAWRDSRLRYAVLAMLPVSIVFFQHEASLPLYLVRDLGLSEKTYGLLFTVNTAIIIALEVPLNAAMAHWPHQRAMALGAALFAAGFGAFGLVTSAAGIYAAVAIWTFGEMILFPTSTAYVSDISPPHRRGGYMGLYMMSFSLAFIVAPPAGVWVLETLGAQALWACAFAVGLLAAYLLSKC